MYSPFMWGPSALGLGMAAGAGLLLILMAWSLFWKGMALWHAGRNGQKIWFVVLLLLNTAGILEIIYLLFYRKDVETKPFASLFVFGTPKAAAPEKV